MTDRINRRDFINGVAMAIAGVSHIEAAGAAASGAAPAGPGTMAPTGGASAAVYPPLRSGLRGSHVGSFEVAHRLRDGAPFAVEDVPVTEHYDLVVVGAGLSGLSAAHFYRQRRKFADF